MPTKSVYLDENTTKLVENLANTKGLGVSELLREVLCLISRASGAIEQLALVQDCSTFASGLEKDTYGFDTWIDVQSTRKVLLVGTTMYNALSRYEEVWKSLLSSGASLQVLLQGGIEKILKERPHSFSASLILGENADDIVERKNSAITVLRDLRAAIAQEDRGRLEARQTEKFFITQSTIVVWDKNSQDKVAVQVHPATGQSLHGKDLRFSFVTSEKSRIYAAIIRPIADLWSSATPICWNDGATAIQKD